MRLPVHNRSQAGLSLVELMISIAIASFVGVAVASLIYHFSRTSTTLINYAAANGRDRVSIEIIGRDIRGAQSFLQLSSTNIVLFGTNAVQLAFNAKSRELRRIVPGQNQVLLANCSGLRFDFYERNLLAGNFETLLPSTSTNCRVVQMNWLSLISSNKQNVFSVSNSVKFLNRRVL